MVASMLMLLYMEMKFILMIQQFAKLPCTQELLWPMEGNFLFR